MMVKFIHSSVLILLVLLDTYQANPDVEDTLTGKRLDPTEKRVDKWKQQCFIEGESAFPCLSQKILDATNAQEYGLGAVDKTLGLFMWLNSLPVLKPNTSIINEARPGRQEGGNVIHINDGCKLCICEHYRFDFGAYHSLIKDYHNDKAGKWNIFSTIINALVPPSVHIQMDAAHTTPFAELFETELHGLTDYKDVFVFIFFMEPFKKVVSVKSRIKLREHIDPFWPIKARWYKATNAVYVIRNALRYRNVAYVQKRLQFYHLNAFRKLHKNTVPLVPFVNIINDDVYYLLEGTDLITVPNFVGQTKNHRYGQDHVKSGFNRLVKNLVAFLGHRKNLAVKGIECFYVVEMRLRQPKTSLYDIMEYSAVNNLLHQPMRYVATATFRDIRHMKKALMLVRMFSISLLACLLAIAATFYHMVCCKAM